MFGQMGRSTGSCIVSSAASRSSPEAVSAVLSTSSGTLPLLAGRPAMARLDTVWLKREATPSPYGLLYEALRTSRRIVRFLSFPCGVSRYNSFSGGWIRRGAICQARGIWLAFASAAIAHCPDLAAQYVEHAVPKSGCERAAKRPLQRVQVEGRDIACGLACAEQREVGPFA